jgi:Cu/Ag efflux pump CusA
MAFAVLGGLVTSTLLSLLVIPPVFSYLDDIKHLVMRLFGVMADSHRQA